MFSSKSGQTQNVVEKPVSLRTTPLLRGGKRGSAYRFPENAQTHVSPTLFLGNFTISFPQAFFVYVLENSKDFDQSFFGLRERNPKEGLDS